MILVHMEVHSKYHLLMVDSFQIRSGVDDGPLALLVRGIPGIDETAAEFCRRTWDTGVLYVKAGVDPEYPESSVNVPWWPQPGWLEAE